MVNRITRHTGLLTIFFLFFSIVFSGIAVSKEINFHISADSRTLYLGESLPLSLRFQGSSKIPAPELREMDGFQSRYIGPSTRMSIVNGKMTSSVTHMYRLLPVKTGRFQVGPITFKHKGDSYVSNVITVEVLDSSARSSGRTGGDSENEVSLSDRAFVKLIPSKTTVYVNEIIPLTIKLYVNNIGLRDIQYPEYTHEGFSSKQFNKPRQYEESDNGIVYEIVEFNTELFASSEGEYALGPARIKGNILTEKRRRRSSRFDDFLGRDPFDGFFGGYETHPVELKSEGVHMKVLPLPDNGKPDGFAGAVGEFVLDMEISPAEVRVGDPVTVKFIISGLGNFDTVTSPVISDYNGFKVYEPQVAQEDGRKIFEQILIPELNTLRAVPTAVFSYFSTKTGRYEMIKKDSIPLKVLKPEKREQATIFDAGQAGSAPVIKEKFGRDIIYIKDSPGTFRKKGEYIYGNSLFILFQVLPVLLCLTLFVINRRKQKLSTDVGYARRLTAPRKAKKGMKEAERLMGTNSVVEFYDAVFTTMRDYLGNRYHVASGGMTTDDIDNLMGGRNIDSDLQARLKRLFSDCDMARYAPSEVNDEGMGRTLRELREIIDYLERHKG